MNVSLIVPVYKGEQYIANLLHMARENNSTLQQAYPGAQMELLLVNDYPTAPLSVPECSDNAGPTVRVIENQKNLGIHGTRVNGLAHAAGEFVLFLDQDDRIESNCIVSHLNVIGDADVSVGNGYKMQGEEKRTIYRNSKKHQLATKIKYFLYAACQIVSPGHCLLRRSSIPEAWKTHIIEKNGGDDLFLWLLMFSQGAKFIANPEKIYTHVDTGENVSADQMTMIRSAYNVIEQMKNCGQVNPKAIHVYHRRVRFLEQLEKGSKLQKIFACIKNLDICLCKLYAYYR